ncbi:WD40 repeat domain-containing protein, partial [Zavarzinella formosa]|uniref:WD40 repeat domain-containing protein n=1 Tax=Zavarzinella formosa TaxID=360055 RepID=UPI001EE67729
RVTAGADISAITLSADQQTLIGTGPRWVKRWNVSDGRELSPLGEEGKHYSAPAVSSDGSLVVAFEEDTMSVHVWDAATGRAIHRLTAGGVGKRVAAFSPDGRRLAFATSLNKISVFDLATGRAGKPLADASMPTALLFSPDGKTVAALRSGYTLHLWDAETGELRDRTALQRLPGNDIAFSPDGRIVAVIGDAAIVLCETATGRKLKTLSVPDNLTAAFSRDGRTLAAGGRTIRLADVATGKLLNTTAGHEGPVCGIAFAPDGRTLASAGEDRTVRVWDTRTSRELIHIPDHKNGTFRLVFTPDGRTLISADGEGVIQWSEAATGRPVRQQSDLFASHALAVSPDGALLVCGNYGQIQLWDGAGGKNRGLLGNHRGLITSLSFAAGGRILISANYAESGVQLWDMQTLARWRALEKENLGKQKNTPSSVAVTPDGRMLATHNKSGEVHLWETATAGERRTIPTEIADIAELAFSADGQILAVAGPDGLIQFLDLAGGRKMPLLSAGPLESGASPAIAFSPDGRLLATVRNDATIMLWPAPALPPLVGKLSKRPGEVWNDLASDHAATADQAIRTLTACPADAVIVLKSHFKPFLSPSREAITRWVTDLDNDRFAVRERAGAELAKLRQLVVPALKAGLKNKPGEESRSRIEKLLAQAEAGRLEPTGDQLREIRGVEILESMGTPAARQLLESLASGTPEARLTQEAKESLSRLNSKARLSGGTP